MNDSFTFEKKKKLMEKIQNLKDKNEINDIRNIIFLHTKDPPHMKNSNGMFFVFDDLSEATYVELTKYIDKKNKKKLTQLEKEINQASELLSEELEAIPEKKTHKIVPKNLKLTNAETHLLNRRKYEQELKKNEGGIPDAENNDDIFIKHVPAKKGGRKKNEN